jgi:hypothetical protein
VLKIARSFSRKWTPAFDFKGHVVFLNFNSTFYLSTEIACQQIQIGWLVDVTNKKEIFLIHFSFCSIQKIDRQRDTGIERDRETDRETERKKKSFWFIFVFVIIGWLVDVTHTQKLGLEVSTPKNKISLDRGQIETNIETKSSPSRDQSQDQSRGQVETKSSPSRVQVETKPRPSRGQIEAKSSPSRHQVESKSSPSRDQSRDQIETKSSPSRDQDSFSLIQPFLIMLTIYSVICLMLSLIMLWMGWCDQFDKRHIYTI